MSASPRRTPWVLSLADVGDTDVAAAGVKATNLARMLRAGLPVPTGFCVTGRAYREHLAAHGLVEPIRRALSQLEGAADRDREPPLAEIRQAIAAAPLAAEPAREIERSWPRLGGAAAVRSSATVEDLPGGSFAGLYETYLAVADLATCLRRVRECWASLWTRRAFAYRLRRGMDHLAADMAVIVQALVAADAAGVMFTADPLSGRRDRVVIEGSFGLGEGVVGGRLAPDRIVVARDGFGVEDRAIASKTHRIVPADTGGVREQAVDPRQADRPCVDDATAERLARLADEIERLFAAPQDVEWAVAGGQAYVLQARPITALPPEPEPTWEDRQVWTNVNFGDAMPDVASPMSLSLVRCLLRPLFGTVMRPLGVELDLDRLVGLVGGRLYVNMNTAVAIARALPGTHRDDDPSRTFGGSAEALKAFADLGLRDEDLPEVSVPRHWYFTRLPGLVLWFLTNCPRKGPGLLARVRASNRAVADEPWRALPAEALVRRTRELLSSLDAEFIHDGMPILFVGMAYCVLLTKLCQRWFGQDGEPVANRLLAGLGGLEDAEAGLELWRLAAAAHEDPAVERAVREERSFAAVRERIAPAAGAGAFLARWEAFLRTHGHHTRGEVELANARWAEQPDDVLAMVRSCLSGLGRVDPVARARRLARQRAALKAACLRRLRSPLTRLAFQAVLRNAQQGLRFRETSKSQVVRRLAQIRWLLLELAGRLVEQGAIARRQDVFFLRLEELAPAATGRNVPELRRRLSRRRAEYDRNAAVTPPTVVVGRFDPDRYVPPAERSAGDRLTGLGASPGVARGRARVILHVQDDHVRPGEVLVAPFADPGWSPYFVSAAGVVIDRGGLLSHSSILAREYGIPCVVNVGPATRTVRTGQILEVDGTRGEVRIVPGKNPRGTQAAP